MSPAQSFLVALLIIFTVPWMVWLITCGPAAGMAGLHFMVGAFLAGAVTERRWFEEKYFDQPRETVLLTMMPIFFLATGLRTRFDVGGTTVVLAALGFLITSVAGKLAGVQLAGRFPNWRKVNTFYSN